MPSTKVFITGATGYIGGDALYHLAQTHSNLDLSLLVRSESKAKAVQEKYPDARIVIGGLDDADIIRREAAWADIVLRE
jgi:N-acetyl-gamma-glutamylphosphate reductase